MGPPLSGGRSCGAIRCECSAKPLFPWACHCRDRQRASGGACCLVMYVPRTTFGVMDPEAKYATIHAESGRPVSRGLCASCGSDLFILADLVPAMQGFWASSLDDPNISGPQVDVWTRGAPRWGPIAPGLKRLDVAPDAEWFQALLAEAATAGLAPVAAPETVG